MNYYGLICFYVIRKESPGPFTTPNSIQQKTTSSHSLETKKILALQIF